MKNSINFVFIVFMVLGVTGSTYAEKTYIELDSGDSAQVVGLIKVAEIDLKFSDKAMSIDPELYSKAMAEAIINPEEGWISKNFAELELLFPFAYTALDSFQIKMETNSKKINVLSFRLAPEVIEKQIKAIWINIWTTIVCLCLGLFILLVTKNWIVISLVIVSVYFMSVFSGGDHLLSIIVLLPVALYNIFLEDVDEGKFPNKAYDSFYYFVILGLLLVFLGIRTMMEGEYLYFKALARLEVFFIYALFVFGSYFCLYRHFSVKRLDQIKKANKTHPIV